MVISVMYAAAAMAAAVFARQSTRVSVHTSRGVIDGLREASGVETFKGIRFATVPTRFERAAPIAKKWTVPVDASSFGAKCMQGPSYLRPEDTMAEDCLFLNIWRPDSRLRNNATSVYESTLPVLVFIHGGGMLTGSGSDFNGTSMATTRNAIVVTLNYRLGPFGFLTTESSGKGGMNGVHDQLIALEFIYDVVDSFGGDVTKMLVFGESAGGISTCILAVSPMVHPKLIPRALIESGPCT